MLIVLFQGCKLNHDGLYLVYKTERATQADQPEGGHLSGNITPLMLSKLKGKKFKITFNEDYATLSDEGSTDDVILNVITRQNKYKGGFEGEFTKGDDHIFVVLFKDEKASDGYSLIFTSWLREHYEGELHELEYGQVICRLDKLD